MPHNLASNSSCVSSNEVGRGGMLCEVFLYVCTTHDNSSSQCFFRSILPFLFVPILDYKMDFWGCFAGVVSAGGGRLFSLCERPLSRGEASSIWSFVFFTSLVLALIIDVYMFPLCLSSLLSIRGWGVRRYSSDYFFCCCLSCDCLLPSHCRFSPQHDSLVFDTINRWRCFRARCLGKGAAAVSRKSLLCSWLVFVCVIRVLCVSPGLPVCRLVYYIALCGWMAVRINNALSFLPLRTGRRWSVAGLLALFCCADERIVN